MPEGVRTAREPFWPFLRTQGTYSIPGLVVLAAVGWLAVAHGGGPHGYIMIFLYVPLAAAGALAAALPVLVLWRTAPLVLVGIAAAIFLLGAVPFALVAVTVIQGFYF